VPLLILALLLLLTLSNNASAQCTLQSTANSHNVPITLCYEIIGPLCICRDVTNNSPNGLGLFVPTKTLGEWQTFYNNPPTGVTATNTCGIDTFKYSRTITIDETKMGGADATNFPMAFSGTYAYLATTANGGKVESANGWDIMFTSDVTGMAKLDHEVESWNAVTGAVNMWVRIPTASATVPTVIYLWYGKACVAAQENRTGVWDSNYRLVWHMAGTGGATLAVDSTTYAKNGTGLNGVLGTTAKFGGGAQFDGTNDYLMTPLISNPPFTNVTISAWVRPNAAGGMVMAEIGQPTANSGWHDSHVEVSNTGISRACMWIGGIRCVNAGSGITGGSWNYMVMRYAASGTTLSGIHNGNAPVTSVATKLWPSTSNLYYSVGAIDATNGGSGGYFNGTLDEIRISNIARTNAWLTAEYNSTNSPSTFYTVGAEVAH
jgi:hypothetical protein